MIEQWEQTRKIALQMLQPDERTLAHGLELHQNSYVFDAYGFMPIGGGRCPQLDELIRSGASRNETKRAYEKFCSNGSFNDPEMRLLLKEAWEFAGVDCNFQNSGIEGNDALEMLFRLSCFTDTVDRLSDIYERAVFPDQLEKIRQRGHKALYMTTNGVPLPCRSVSAEESLNLIGVFFRLGVRMMHLTYNRRNLIGDGCAESANGGLSAFGRDVVAEMNRCGVIPDVAHCGQKTSFDTAKVSSKPVVASHSAAGALSAHYRCKSDEVIQAVKESGGYVGVCCHPPFLQGGMNIVTMLDHVEYIARKFGVDHVAIGTDNGVELEKVELTEKLPVSRNIFESYWPAPGAGYESMTEEQYRSVNWLNWPMFTVGLVQRGFSDEEIRKIIGGNVLRVVTETLEK